MRKPVMRASMSIGVLLLGTACNAAPQPPGEETAATAAAAEEPWAEPTDLPPDLVQARAALERYQDPVAAVHDGYLSTVGCIEYPEGGAEGAMQYVAGGMGVHFINMQNVGPTLDPAKPQVLIYQPHGDRLRLAAAEWFAPAQLVTGAPPQIFGQTLQGPMEGHRPLMPEGLHHYDLHVWLWKNNPAGVFSPTNPDVKCPSGAAYSIAEAAPRMVGHGH